jgi:hypothetical protein
MLSIVNSVALACNFNKSEIPCTNRCGSCKNRRFGGTYRLIFRVEIISELGTSAVSSNCNIVRTDVPPKRRFLQEKHGVTSQDATFFTVTSVITSDLT